MPVDQFQIPENPEKDERDRQSQVVGPEPRRRLLREGIDRVADQGGPGDYRDLDVQHLIVISRERLAVACPRAVQEDLLVAPFAEGQKEGEEEGAEQQPGGDPHRDRGRASDRPQDEAEGDHEDIHVGETFEEIGVGHLHQRVSAENRQEGAGQPERRHTQTDGGQQGGHHAPGGGADLARGQRTQPLHRMEPVGIAVPEVVHDVDRAGEETEAEGRQPHAGDRPPAARVGGLAGIPPREEVSRRNHDVLHPLRGAQQTDPGGKAGMGWRVGVTHGVFFGGSFFLGERRKPERIQSFKTMMKASVAILAFIFE